MSVPNDPREEPLNEVARRIMVASNYDPHFSGIENRLIMETKLFLARYDALHNDLSKPIKHYGAMLDELEGRKTVYRVGEGVEQINFITIDMIIFCPQCGLQHIDAPEDHKPECAIIARAGKPPCNCGRWTNPPHRSHLCGYCNHVWRHADVPTNGVLAIRTEGKEDSKPALRRVSPLDRFLPKWLHKKRGTTYREIGRGELQRSFDEDHQYVEGTRLVAYQGDDNRVWFRLETEFEDGRFEKA